MKNGIYGFITILLIVFTGVAIQTSSTRSIRQNELDSNLAKAMESSMQALTVDPAYAINQSDPEELIANLVQSILVNTTSTGDYDVIVHTVDVEKGILDCEVKETYKQVVGSGTVSARKTIILEEYKNEKNEYFNVTFMDSESGTVLKQLNVHGGDRLTQDCIPSSVVSPKGKRLIGWKIGNLTGITPTYTAENITSVHVTKDLVFTTYYVSE